MMINQLRALPTTHQGDQDAKSIGVSRETVSRALADFGDQHVIRVNRGQITVLQPDKLQGLAAC